MRSCASVVLVGGGAIPPRITQKMLDLARGVHSHILICPFASTEADTGRRVARDIFEERHGCRKVRVMDWGPEAHWREFAHDSARLEELNGVDLFYFTGGDQRRLLHVFRDSPFTVRLLERWRQGLTVIAGTSAGLQIHAALAFTGEVYSEVPVDPLAEETRYTRIASREVGLEPGLGLLPKVILDQHFVRRQRQNRLFSAILDHPDHLGIGVDESTALVLSGPSGSQVMPEVIGESCVFYCNGRGMIKHLRDDGRLGSIQSLDCGIVWEGARFPFPLEIA
jgi:cyanophycinase